MALALADRVQDTTATTGTGTITLNNTPPAGFQSFATIGNGNTTYYTITSGTAWEVGIGTYSSAGTTLARTTILSSSNSGSAISLTGTSTVFVTYPAERSINKDATGNTTLTGAAVTAAYWGLNGISVAQSGALYTDTTNTGSQSVAINAFGKSATYDNANLINSANVYGSYFYAPAQGPNITGGNFYSIGTDGSAYIAGSLVVATGTLNVPSTSPGSAIASLGVSSNFTTTGTVTLTGGANTITITNTTAQIFIGGAAATGAITVGRSTGSQTVNISNGVTASGSTNTIQIGTAGATGSTTTITIGSSAGTSTTTVNGTLSVGSSMTVGSAFTQNGGTATIAGATAAVTANIAAGATTSGNTKAVNIGTGGLTGSTTTITLGSTFSTTTTVNGSTVFTGTFQSQGYTVATLPAAGTAGRRAHVTDALAPTFLGTLTGGGAVKCPVFDNGTAWVAG